MAEYQMVVGGFLNKPLTGRRPIETPETEINQANVLKVVMGKAEPIHLLNKNEIRFLHNYYLGSQPVLHRTKEYHAEITNRIVENHANECVGFYTGYSEKKTEVNNAITNYLNEKLINASNVMPS